MHIYLKNNPAKFHPLGIFEQWSPQQEKNNSDMGSVHDPKIKAEPFYGPSVLEVQIKYCSLL